MGRFLVFFIVLVDLLAAGCTYLCGAIVIPNVLNLALWLADDLGRFLFYLLAWGWLPHLPILRMPIDLTQAVAARNKSWGLLWLGLYVFTRVHFFWKSSLMQKHAPANTMYPDEKRWELVEKCTQQYSQALTRFLKPPIQLRIPSALQYEERTESMLITWHGRVPIIPTALLSEGTQPILAALLALELAKYNSSDLFIRTWMSTYPLMRPDRRLALLGIFFWLPASLLRLKLYKDWCKERELTYDTFAYLCGQGERLLRILRFNEANDIQIPATEYEPGTLERIGHLEALLHQEHQQMARLGLQIPDLPGPLPPMRNLSRIANPVQHALLPDQKASW